MRGPLAGAVAVALLVALAGCRQGADVAPVTAPVVGPQPGASSRTTAARRGVTYITGCAGKPVRLPRTLITACADGNEGIARLRWRGWGTGRAIGSGVLVTNTCTPSCVRGQWEVLPATVVLDRIRNGEAAAYYTRMVVSVAGDDAGSGRNDVYRLADAEATTPVGPVLVN